MNAVTMVIKPINGKRNALTTPISTPTFIITISLFNNSTTSAESPKNYLKGKFYSSVKDHFLIATEKMTDSRFEKRS